MGATRIHKKTIKVISRVFGEAGFVFVEAKSHGRKENLQRQCSTGELEFNMKTNKFVCMRVEKKSKKNGKMVIRNEGLKDTRRPFDPKKVAPDVSQTATLKMRFPVG